MLENIRMNWLDINENIKLKLEWKIQFNSLTLETNFDFKRDSYYF